MAADSGWCMRLLVVAMAMTCLLVVTSAAKTGLSGKNLEIQKLLKTLNKPPVKSIKSSDGDIIDCVLATHQPAFNHPLLINHTIQTRPSSVPKGLFDETNVVSFNDSIAHQVWHLSGSCPDGTVSIRRTRKADLLRASSIKEFGKKKPKTIPPQTISPHEYAVAGVSGDKYYGTKANMNIWKPDVQKPNEFSLSQLWIVAGSYLQNDLNTIEVGWQAYQQLYGDSNTRLFNYWTSDAYKSTGCYNMACSGFVQVSNIMVVGGTLNPVSVFGGSQYEIPILVWKDQKSGNWWLMIKSIMVGYWPSSLFTHLSDSASTIQWGGEIVNVHEADASGSHTSTQMGSGRFPEEGFGKASYFRNIQTVDATNTLRKPSALGFIVSLPQCYNIKAAYATNSWGQYFFYGGSGKNSNCP